MRTEHEQTRRQKMYEIGYANLTGELVYGLARAMEFCARTGYAAVHALVSPPNPQ
jgi:hypothetical protein